MCPVWSTSAHPFEAGGRRFDPVTAHPIDLPERLRYIRGGGVADRHGRTVMSMLAAGAPRTLGRLLPPWWVFLVSGIIWMLVGLIVLRFDYTSVRAISILFGFVALFAGLFEVAMTIIVAGWWRLLNGLLAVVFIVTGIVSFIHPGNTFVALA